MPVQLPVFEVRTVYDHSILSTVTKCQRLAFYKYFLNRAAIGEDTVSMNFGTHYHTYRETLDQLYIENPSGDQEHQHNAALIKALKGFENPPLEHKKSYLDAKRLILSCETAKQSVFNERATKSKIILSTETSFELPLPSGRLYGGRFDRIIEWNGRLWVVDYKTTSWMLNDIQAKYDLDHQMSGYVWAAELLSGRPIAGVLVELMYNTSAKKAELKAILTTRTKGDIKNFIDWAESKWDTVEKCIETNIWPMCTTACFDFMKKCSFHQVCSRGGDLQDALNDLVHMSIESKWDHAKIEGD